MLPAANPAPVLAAAARAAEDFLKLVDESRWAESLSLAWEDGAWKVAGIAFD